MNTFSLRKLNGLLRTEIIGKVIHYHEEAASTNSLLSELARSGASEGTVVIADKQTAGKGRLGRKWFSPPGVNLYLSVLLRPGLTPSDSQLATFLASVALTDTIRKTGIDDVWIKWPNDILIGRKKAAGVLTELEAGSNTVEFMVIGMGVNINMKREQMDTGLGAAAGTATSLCEAAGREIDRAKFSADLLMELEKWYETFKEQGRSVILRQWSDRWGGKGRKARVTLERNNGFEGRITGIDDRGALQVQKDDAEIVDVITGDVELI